jgi:hypothetical protein
VIENWISGVIENFFSKRRSAVSNYEWNQSRSERVFDEQEVQRKALVATANRVHWLSAVCYLEQVEPQALRLTPELHERVLEEIEELGEFDGFAVYAELLTRFDRAKESEITCD